MNQSERVCLWDNLKCLLIILVVVGHFANQFVEDSVTMRSVSIFIYSFHMPLFIFLSGLLEKKWNEKHPFRWEKPIYYILIGYILKLLIYVIKVAFGEKAEFSFFSDTGIPWYMFAMAAFMVMMYGMRKWNPKIVLPLSIVIACLAGYIPFIGSFLYLSRILVFFPFYYMGYHLDGEIVRKLTRKTGVKTFGAVVMAVCLFVSVFRIDEVYSYIRLLTGRNAYAFIHVEGCGFWHRLLCYGISFIVGLAVVSLTPERKLRFAGIIGQRTLQIYFWHRLVLYVMMFSGFADLLKETFSMFWIPVYLCLAVLITLALSMDLFGYPLYLLKKYERRIERRIVAYNN